MKGLKIFTVIALVALLIVGWATFTIDKGTKIASYNSSVSTADQYVEEGLYQRAILKYKEALQNDNSEKTWTKMFAAYELRYKEDARILSDYITDIQSALNLYPKNVEFTKKLYELHMASDDVENAYACLNIAIANGINDKEIISNARKLKYSYKLDHNTYSDFKDLSAETYMVSNGEKWGYIDTTGEEIVDYIYPFASSLNGNNIRILHTALGNRLFDDSGMVLGIFKFDITDAGLYSTGLIPVCKDGKYAYYNSFAKEQFGGYDYAGTFQDGVAVVKKDSQWTMIGTDGKENGSKFTDVLVDDNGLYLKGDVMIASKEAGKYQMFDKDGKSANKFSATKMDMCMSDGLIAFEKDSKWGFVNTSGKVVIEPSYENANSFSNGLAAVCKDGKWGFINISNELVTRNIFFVGFRGQRSRK